MLVEFTGSDWCPPCIAMRKNVFSKPDFVAPASKKYILVELDFPNGDTAVKEKNTPFAEKYKIEGFPTVILFTSEGKNSLASSPPNFRKLRISWLTSRKRWSRKTSIDRAKRLDRRDGMRDASALGAAL